MIRPSADPKPLEELGVEIVRGDITDEASTAAAMEGCGRVHHVAAGFLMWSTDPERDIVRPSVDGTRNVLGAAARAGVDKVLYVSTSGTIGFPERRGDRRDESHFNTNPHTWYLKGKIAAEREAFAIREREKLPVTTINPTLILGPRFFKLSESVRQIVDYVNDSPPIYFDGGFTVVDAEDVARGAMLAMGRGGDGERYVIGGDDVTVKEAFDACAELIGVKPPSIRLPVPVLRVLAGGMELASKVTRRRPMLDRSMVDEFAGVWGYHDSSKAKRELGYEPRGVRETLARTIAWALDSGFVPEKRRNVLRPSAELQGSY
jgi:dihydroflavonol-4-reductase